MSNILMREYPRVLLSAEQIARRVRKMARRISEDYRGKTIDAGRSAGKRLYFRGCSLITLVF